MAYDEMFGDEPLDQDALIASLGGTPPPQTVPPELIAKLQQLVATMPQTPAEHRPSRPTPRPPSPRMRVQLPGPLGQEPSSPAMRVQLNGPLGQEPRGDMRPRTIPPPVGPMQPLPPVGLRDELQIDPMAGPTRAREPRGGDVGTRIDNRTRALVAQQHPEGVPPGRPPLDVQGGLDFGGGMNTAAMAGIPASVSGVVGSLMDQARDRYDSGQGVNLDPRASLSALVEALREGGARGAVAPYQQDEDKPTVSGEFVQRGADLNELERLAIDAFSDPSNIGGGSADDLARGAGVIGMAAKGGKAGTVVKEGAEAVGDVLGKVLKPKKAPKVKPPPPFEFAPVDATAKARMTMLGQDAPIQYRQLPSEARPTSLSKTLTTPPATPDAGVGVTINPATGQMVVGGRPGPVMAGKFPNSSARTIGPIPVGQFTPQHIKDFYDANRDVFAKDPKVFLGGWLDKKTNSIFLDVSKGFKTVRKATKFAEEQNPGTVQGKMKGKPTGIERDPVTGIWPQAQKNLYDPETFAEPPVGNNYEFLTGKVRDTQGNTFRERVDQMAQRGEKVMGGEDPEWWDLRKTARNPNAPIPRIYGDDNVKPVAGYTATMSPQNDPYNDAQMASEYMRRHIKGEPVVQPDWVAPPTAMGPQGDKGGFSPSPGMKFPNEDFYAINANKVREGRYEELTQDKVNDMYHALIGEDVGVLDRHFAKIGEDPISGIYSADEPNVMTPSMTSGKLDNYATMYNQVRDAAIAAGKPMKQYSAYVWEGIRDTIRQTGDLFGQKHRATAVPDTTTGFNEIFDDLIQRKAKHLGITVEKMESLLRSGDAELLGAILATPVGIEAYRRWNAAKPPTQKDGGV